MSRFLVTGGGGFIGSNLTEALLRQGHDVRVLDNFSTGRPCNLERAADWARSGGGEFELLEADLRDEKACASAMKDIDNVLHKAAIPSVQRSIDDPGTTNEVNLVGTLNLLRAAKQTGVQRFVFASSSSIYGESETLPKRESMPNAPISPYGLQKACAEAYCSLFWDLYRLPTVALRYFNVFGPRQDPHSEYSAVIPRFLAAVRAGRRPTVYGDGEQSRDFTFVANVVQANLLACEAAEGVFGKTFNIGCGERVSLNQLLRSIGELAGRAVEVDYAPPRDGDILHSMAAIDAARSELGYDPQIGLAEGLRQTFEEF